MPLYRRDPATLVQRSNLLERRRRRVLTKAPAGVPVNTTLWLHNANHTFHRASRSNNLAGVASAWRVYLAGGTQASGGGTINANTVTGPTSGIEVGATPAEWLSEPIDADVTISGAITGNLWASESSLSANAAINFVVERIDARDLTLTEIARSTNTTELPLTTRAVHNFTVTPSVGVACNKGDRIRIRVFIDDVGTMATGFTATLGFSGTTPGADSDSWVGFTESFGFQTTTPSGSQLFLTDTASAVATASVDREVWTTRGGSALTDVTNTTTGPVPAGIQVTDTAGGTVVDWFSRPLQAFTLSGLAQLNLHALESNASANAGVAVQIARVDGDGTNPTVWAYHPIGAAPPTMEIGTTEAAYAALAGGDDLAFTAGQRLRIRLYVVDSQSAMANGFTVTTYYGGPTGGASGDTFVTLPQTVTEVPVGLEWINTAEGGTDEVAPTTGNSGGASGTAWSGVVTGGSALMVFDDDFDQSDTMGYRISSGAAQNSFLRWDTSGLPTAMYMRACFAISAWPAANTVVMRSSESDLTQGYAVRIRPTGLVELVNASSVVLGVNTTPIPIDTWIKVEAFGNQTTGAWEIKWYYDANSTTPDESDSGSGASLGAGGFAEARYGTILGTGFFDDIWLDNLGVSDYRYPVVTDNFPVVSAAPTVMIQRLVLPLSFALPEEVPLAPSVLAATGNNADQTSYVTASISPTAPVLAFVDFSRNDSVQPVTPTLSGAKATWTQVGTTQYYKSTGSTSRVSFAAFIGTGASTPGAVTIDFGGVTHSGCVWSLIDLVGAAASPVVQSAVNLGNPGNTVALSATLATGTPAAAGNRCFVGCGFNTNITTVVDERVNWSELSVSAQGTPSEGIQTQWRSDTFEATGSATNNSGGAMVMGLVVVEISVDT